MDNRRQLFANDDVPVGVPLQFVQVFKGDVLSIDRHKHELARKFEGEGFALRYVRLLPAAEGPTSRTVVIGLERPKPATVPSNAIVMAIPVVYAVAAIAAVIVAAVAVSAVGSPEFFAFASSATEAVADATATVATPIAQGIGEGLAQGISYVAIAVAVVITGGAAYAVIRLAK